ncbi:(d)CMP kinase [Thermoanaerobacterium sp. RBIITD]|uniref:(d)CMP kinase n=1 Tax=Thermoanaerobacterium sp. RBIITD TaxID=1550240 RepID=UPI000BB6A0E6|nr:(d)CMP kinase [Thermoanaerobacterium sp. RBIITD]SNX55422.1 cytidylate kinase [Thermoanaerobacterium sp. RBIITD]
MTIKVAIDGPAGAGKSTVAKKLAEKLRFTYIDTGAMYRALTYKILKDCIDINDKDKIIDLAKKCDLKLKGDKIFLNNINVTDMIRNQDVTEKVSLISKIPEVRDIMVQLQKSMSQTSNVIMDGRDITTVVMPDAQFKFYLTASDEIRAKRRYDELKEKNIDVKFEDILCDIKRRDKIDMERDVAPLKISEDAIVIDTSYMSIDEVVDKLYGIIAKK